jgi:hypothetical protein
MLENCPTQIGHRGWQGQPRVRSCRRTRISRSDRHDAFLWPLSWLYQGIQRVCVPRWKPCCVVIMHSSHKLTPRVHIIHQRRLEAWVSWFLMILVISSNLSSGWLLPPTHTCGPVRKIPLEMSSRRADWLAWQRHDFG